MSANTINSSRLRRLLSSLTLAAAVSTTMAAPAARADEDVTCTLQRSIKVKVGAAFVPVDAGAKIKVKVRRAEWSTVETPAGSGVTATKVLEQTCKPLPPRPPEPAAGEKPAKAEKPPKVAKVVPPKPPKAEKPPKPPKPPKAEKPPKVVKAKPMKPVKGKKGAPVVEPEAIEPTVVEPVAVAVVAPPAVAPVAPVVAPAAPVVEAAPVEAAPVEPAAVEPAAVEPAAVEPAAVVDASTLKAIRVAVHRLAVDAPARTKSPRLDVVGTAALAHELAKLTGVSVIDLDKEVSRLGPDGTTRLRACADDACVANLASAAGADDVVIGTVTTTATGQTLSARRLAVLPLAPIATYEGTAVDDEGTVRLAGAAADALFVERQRREGAVLGPSTELVARLSPPPVPPAVTAAVGAVAVAGVVVAGVATVFNQLAYNEGQQAAQASSAAAPADGAQLAGLDATVQSSFLVLTVAGVSAAVLAVGTGVLAVFTDWGDLAGEPPPATPTTTTAPPPGADAAVEGAVP